MPTLYYKPASYNDWAIAANWFTNAAGTIPAGGVPWVEDNAFKDYNLEFATGVTLSPIIGDDAGSGTFGQGFTITGVCNMALQFGYQPFEGNGGCNVYGGTWSGAISLYGSQISGGTFQSAVTVANNTSGVISNGVFNGSVSGVSIYNGTFNSTVSSQLIQAGTFNGAVTSTGGTSGGTFNSSFTKTSGNVTGGTFNGSFTQTAGNISGGTFNGTYTRVTGNVSGGTFNKEVMYQFFREGWPPPLVFTGYNPKALDVLGTGLV